MKKVVLAWFLLAGLAPVLVHAQAAADPIVEARDALRKKDKPRLAALRQATAGHPLAQWVDYWELSSRLTEAQQPELDAFFGRWPGTYVEDRLRNDWLLELGKRRDWVNFRAEAPRFRMNDDREVTCYQLLTQHLAGQDVRVAARAAWYAQRDLDDGCNLLATTLFEAKRLTAADVWQEARLSVEFNRPRAARAAVALVAPASVAVVDEIFENPARRLTRRVDNNELALLALLRMAANDPESATLQFTQQWQRRFSADQVAWAWAGIGRQAAFKLTPGALEHYRNALATQPKGVPPNWSDDTLAWGVRAALRSPAGQADRWLLVQRLIDAMSSNEQRDPAWAYWKARALQARAASGPEGDVDREAARQALQALAGQLHFYGKLALEETGGTVQLPPPPAPLTPAERDAARTSPGLARALQLIALGLRSEGVREWNYSLRGLADRELLAAAQWACEREVWDRCINTSDRTRAEIDMSQRFPMPYREQVLARARELGLDPAYMYGLIRQESRFILDTRSHVGASGLMQLMPATARWTAKKIGLSYSPEMIADRDTNLRLGAAYLKLVLDDFGGSQALAAAAYNAGPSRPRRWREGGVLEPAIWAETIPFAETRDYVKKVLSNAVYYAALINGTTPSLKLRLGTTIGPRDATAPNADREIP